MTWRQLVYMVLDEIKLTSDDSIINENHVIFLLNKYRTFLLKQRYSDIKKPIPESNYQTICLDLENDTNNIFCGSANYLKSKTKVPFLMKIGNPRVYPSNYFQGEITYVSRDRMRYIGHNKYMQNIIYASVGPDNYLYLTSSNPQFSYLEKVKFTGIFEDIETASELLCSNQEEDNNQEENNNQSCDILDRDFPIEEGLVPQLIELSVRELLGSAYRPADEENNANDDLADIANFIRRNAKSNLAKQLEQ